MPTLLNLTRTCNAFPSQWEADTPDGGRVYIRMRYGYLSWGSGKDDQEAVQDSDRHRKHIEHLEGDVPGTKFWGVMSDAEMLRLLPELWPEWAPLELAYTGHVVP